MNGIHDMGGMQNMGELRAERHEPVFHEPWQGVVFALDTAVPGGWSISAERYQIELIPPADYLRADYYEKWLMALVQLMVKHRVVSQEEINSGKPNSLFAKPESVLKAAGVGPLLAKGVPASRDVPVAASFHFGQPVRSRNINPLTHTRLPRYARGKLGTIAHDHGVFVFSDSDAHGLGEKPQHVYSVRFTARELWGDQANPRDSVYIDLWDDHLHPA